MEVSKYNKDLSYSYVFGAFGTIELLTNQADKALMVLVDPSFCGNEAFNKIERICKEKHIELEVNKKKVDKIKDKGNIFVIGVFKKYESKLESNKHLILNNINDVGVIGTIIRSMTGFNFKDLVLINCDVDIYHEHLIRSTMGAFFKTNIKQYDNLSSYKKDYQNMKYYNICKCEKTSNKIIDDNNISLIFSNEKVDDDDVTHINFDKDISLDNIVNIVLFDLYK